jgi:hypothetical protein
VGLRTWEISATDENWLVGGEWEAGLEAIYEMTYCQFKQFDILFEESLAC